MPRPTPAQSRALIATGTPAGFAWTVNEGRWKLARHLHLINRKLTDLAAGRIKRLMIFCPPRHGKSELCSKHLPAWYLGTFPDRRVMLASYSAEFASDWGLKARRLIEEHGHLFGVRVSSDSAAKSNWTIDRHGGGMVTAGIGGPFTGRGCNLMVIDDPIKNNEDALSPTIRDKHWDWWLSTASTRLEPSGSVLLMMTRWHPDDLAGRLLKEHSAEWEVLSLPALAGHDDPLHRQPGEALWPQQWPTHDLERIKLNQTAYWWRAMYQQQPGRHEKFEWPDEYFNGIWCSYWPDHFDARLVAVDPSKGKDARKGDYSAIVFCGIADGKLWVDSSIERRPVTKLVRDVAEFSRRSAALAVGVEINQFQELLEPEIARTAAEMGGPPLPLYGITNTVNKHLRIGRLGPYLARKEIMFRDTPDNRLLVEMLKEFPNGDHDDGPDALEMAIRLGIELHGGTVDDGIGSNLLQQVA